MKAQANERQNTMFGFLIGTASLIGLMKLWRHGRHGRSWHRGGAQRWVLRRLFERLDTTPGQEKVVVGAIDEAQRKAWAAREAFFSSRLDVAKAMRAETFDSASLNEVFEKQQAAVDDLKKSVREGLQAIHEAMTPEQRTQLADLIEFGPGRFHHGYGHGHHFGHGSRCGRHAHHGHDAVNL